MNNTITIIKTQKPDVKNRVFYYNKVFYICLMARDMELQSQKKQEIVAYFNKLSSVMDFGVKKYTIAYCTAATAQKFYLRPKTVETYIYR